MQTYLVIEYFTPFIRTIVGLYEGPFNNGIVADYKRAVRERGGRVTAVVRLKH